MSRVIAIATDAAEAVVDFGLVALLCWSIYVGAALITGVAQ